MRQSASEQDQEVQSAADWGEPFDFHKAWYPMAVVEDMEQDRPTRLELLGVPLVAWKDGSGEWRVFEDRCPHRLVPLSEGRIESDGTLMCSYHGWRFNGEGRVTEIPQAFVESDGTCKALESPRACASVRPVQVQQGVLFVWGESSEDAALESALQSPILPEELTDPKWESRVTIGGWGHRDFPYGFDYAIENVTDPSHVMVAHHNVASNRYEDPEPLSVDTLRKPSLRGGYRLSPKSHKLHGDFRDNITSYIDFLPPCALQVKQSFPSGAATHLIINVVPTRPGWCRMVGTTVDVEGEDGEQPPGFGFFTAGLPRWVSHIFAPIFLHQDQAFLHYQQANVAQGRQWKKDYWMPCEIDKTTVTFRRWFERVGGIPWPEGVDTSGMNAVPDKKLLFDTWTAHTKHCATCQNALKNVQMAKQATQLSAAALAVAGVSQASPELLAGGAALGLGSGALSKIEGLFFEYPFDHQDNN